MENSITCCADKGVCSTHSYKSLDELTYRMKERLAFLSKEKLNNLFYGYKCAANIDSEIKKLSTYKEVLDRTKISFLHIGKSCNDDETIQLIIEKTNKIIGKQSCPKCRADIKIDDSKLHNYLITGPKCVSYDLWNEFSRFICGKLGLKISAEKQKCDLTFEISREIISCDLLYTLKVHKELCDTGYKVSRTDEECRIDYKLLLEKNSCDLEYKAYVSYVRDFNLSYPIIESIYAAGLSLATENNEAILCTPLNNYKLTEITPDSLQELLDLGFVIEHTRYNIKQDYKK